MKTVSSLTFAATLTLPLLMAHAQEPAETEGLARIDFEELPDVVRERARKELPDDGRMTAEVQRERGQVMYHIMVGDGRSEVGVRMNARGDVLDTWRFNGESEDEEERELAIPTHTDVVYGPHERNVLDLFIADSRQPTPLVVGIHGGGFSGGDKEGLRADTEDINTLLEAGISVAAINYRLTEGGKNPFPIPMEDGVRAVQFLRHNAAKYNFDKERFGAIGGSAGGCMLMWLGFHPDKAQPDSNDPVLRESSRLQALAPYAGQSCLHLPTLEKWFGVDSLEEHPAYRPLFGLPEDGPMESFDGFEAATRAASPITYLTADDPPIYLTYEQNEPVREDSPPGVWVHHRVLGTRLQEAMRELGIECHVEYPGGPPIARYPSRLDFLIKKLTR